MKKIGRKPHTKNQFQLLLKNNNIKYILYGEYIGNHINTTFYCEDHDHYFNALPSNILSGNQKCKLCIKENRTNIFINKLNNKNIKYKLVGEYFNNRTETQFYCKEHDYYFDAIPYNILSGHTRCRICSGKTDWDLESLNQYLQDINKNIIFYEFKTTQHNCLCKCQLCNYMWKARPNNILNGRGCVKCAKTGFDPTKPAILYYIKIDYGKNEFYKIGITNKNVNERFLKQELNYIKILSEQKYNFGIDAYNKEQEILKEFNEYRYVGEPILKSGGNTELFIVDIKELGFQC